MKSCSPFSLPLLDRSLVMAMELPMHAKLMRSCAASPFLAKPVEHKHAQAMSQVVTPAVFQGNAHVTVTIVV
jgi:hypothetical protein